MAFFYWCKYFSQIRNFGLDNEWQEIAHSMMCTFRICEHVTPRRWCRRQLSNGILFIGALFLFLSPLCCPFILSFHSLFLVLSFLTSFRSPSLLSCQYFALLLKNFDDLCPCSPPIPFFCSSFTCIVLIFLPCSPRVPFLTKQQILEPESYHKRKTGSDSGLSEQSE